MAADAQANARIQEDRTVLIKFTNPHCISPISNNAPFRTEMCTFLFWMVHCGIWEKCIVGFVRLVYWPQRTDYFLPSMINNFNYPPPYWEMIKNTEKIFAFPKTDLAQGSIGSLTVPLSKYITSLTVRRWTKSPLVQVIKAQVQSYYLDQCRPTVNL